jgi:hypothetical protein
MIRNSRIARAEGADTFTVTRASFADVTERLMLEFEPTLGLKLIIEVLRACRTDLKGSSPTNLSESLELLARHRLGALATAACAPRTICLRE